MKTKLIFLLVPCFLPLIGVTATLAADQAASAEAQLRERLRATMLQVRTLETEKATLQASQTQATEEKKTLTVRVEALTKQANEYKAVAQQVDGLKAEVARQEKEIAKLKEDLAAQQRALAAAREQHADFAKRAGEVAQGLERLVADRQAKNLALYQIALEILERYEKFSLGDAVKAREPFTGITRVKLQNQVQDYQDKLAGQRVTLRDKDLVAFRDQLVDSAGTTPVPSAPPARPVKGAEGQTP
jgi:chromosome segregation ATPase